MDVVVVGIDQSESSTRAVQFAAELAQKHDESLYIVHVIRWSPYSFNTPSENEHREGARSEELAAAREQVLAPRVKFVEELGVPVESAALHGDPVDLLIEEAARCKAVQIIVGRTGDSRMHRALFGSIPSHLAHLSPVPLTVVP